jgi:hypothetical protein
MLTNKSRDRDACLLDHAQDIQTTTDNYDNHTTVIPHQDQDEWGLGILPGMTPTTGSRSGKESTRVVREMGRDDAKNRSQVSSFLLIS